MVWNEEQMGLEHMEALWGLISREGDMAILMISSMFWQEELDSKGDSHGWYSQQQLKPKIISCLSF